MRKGSPFCMQRNPFRVGWRIIGWYFIGTLRLKPYARYHRCPILDLFLYYNYFNSYYWTIDTKPVLRQKLKK